ncbi:hypothetical protein [Streptomyces alboflavus]|uniref:hypothetical protein n=1 Tax=Streptomyces alboflavus TaxID=67267 RepID=UPI0026A61B07
MKQRPRSRDTAGIRVRRRRLGRGAVAVLAGLDAPAVFGFARDLFCGGHAQLPDGKVLVAGGTAL